MEVIILATYLIVIESLMNKNPLWVFSLRAYAEVRRLYRHGCMYEFV